MEEPLDAPRDDPQSFQRQRMAGDFTDLPVFDAFDAIAVISHASCTHQVAPTPRHPIRPRTPRPAKVGRPTFPERKPP
jgi:hypothetical protein